jgi:aldehyde:ferredoxin oxidoreductase
MDSYGYAGSILSVDLNDRSHSIAGLPDQLVKDYLGGKGFGAKILINELAPRCDPLSPDNIIVFASGPMTGTLIPASSRAVLCTKSPLTGLWLDTNCGGSFGAELKRTGFDIIQISGRSEKPICLVIDDLNVDYIDASEVWGKDTLTTRRWAKEATAEDFKVACVGEAGEKQVLLASVIAEGRAFGRGGSGAVMGAKNLKALAVRGNRGLKIHDLDEFLRENREAHNEIMINPDTGGSRPKYGTTGIYSFVREAGALPTLLQLSHRLREIFPGQGGGLQGTLGGRP